jgi:hypothetical protein
LITGRKEKIFLWQKIIQTMITQGEKDLSKLLNGMRPKHNIGDYVFCAAANFEIINPVELILMFNEKEGPTMIIKKELADKLKLEYAFVASWITFTVHSSLEAIGLTATFSTALAREGISCNVVAAFYHDHIFVAKKDTARAMEILKQLSVSTSILV